MTTLEFVARLGLAAILGIAIGFERQWRQRSAGLHTSTLVAIGASLFALLDVILAAGDTTRIVAGVVTGVGFIAGGVILRQGATVSGLNTAATIWATAAVGALAGFGIAAPAALGAIAIIGFNLLLAPLVEAIDARAGQRHQGETAYSLSVVCDPQSQPAIGAAILESIGASPLSLQSLTRHYADGNYIEMRARIYGPKPQDAAIEKLAAGLLSTPGVVRAEWQSTAP